MVTVPPGETEMSVVPGGTAWKPPTSGKPSLVTQLPVLLSLRAPSRVKARLPSGIWTSRKPSPWMAMSNLLPVLVNSPVVNTLAVATNWEP